MITFIFLQKYPKTDLRISSDKVNLRTCADSCRMLIDLIRYLAEDGDLIYHEPLEIQADTDTDISANVSGWIVPEQRRLL